MLNEDQLLICNQCGRRPHKGAIQAALRGDPRLKKVKTGQHDLYCSERCLREALLGIETDEDPVEALARKNAFLERLVDRVRKEAEEDVEAARRAEGEASRRLGQLLDCLTEIHSEGLLDAVPDTERGQRLRLLVNNVLVIAGVTRRRA